MVNTCIWHAKGSLHQKSYHQAKEQPTSMDYELIIKLCSDFYLVKNSNLAFVNKHGEIIKTTNLLNNDGYFSSNKSIDQNNQMQMSKINKRSMWNENLHLSQVWNGMGFCEQ